MPAATALRIQIESALARRIPSALTPVPRVVRPTVPTGLAELDELLRGGLPLGAITELVGPECSGRTAVALSFVARGMAEEKVCAWIDVSDALCPESAMAAGVDLKRLLWVRCGVANAGERLSREGKFALSPKYFVPPPIKKGLHGGGFGPHPRSEVKGLSEAVNGLLQQDRIVPRCSEPQRKLRTAREMPQSVPATQLRNTKRAVTSISPFTRIEQALRVTDLLLQAGGFGAIVLDLGSIAPEHATRVPAATWFRYRAAAERTHASIVLLTQYPCAKSSAELVLRMEAGKPVEETATLFTGVRHKIEVLRERFAPEPPTVLFRKPPQSERRAIWQSRTTWAGGR